MLHHLCQRILLSFIDMIKGNDFMCSHTENLQCWGRNSLAQKRDGGSKLEILSYVALQHTLLQCKMLKLIRSCTTTKDVTPCIVFTMQSKEYNCFCDARRISLEYISIIEQYTNIPPQYCKLYSTVKYTSLITLHWWVTTATSCFLAYFWRFLPHTLMQQHQTYNLN